MLINSIWVQGRAGRAISYLYNYKQFYANTCQCYNTPSMRILNGSELAGFIKERQAKQVRALRQAHKVFPKIAIIRTTEDPAIGAYVKLKKAYGADILIEVEEHVIAQSGALALIKKLNADPTVHAVIVQLPLADPAQTDELVDAIAPQKDIDGLGKDAALEPATPMAILWLLTGYNIELAGKKIIVVGQGRLVGGPLTRMLKDMGYDVATADKTTEDLAAVVRSADVVITGAGVPGLIKSKMIKPNAVVVDAGVAAEQGRLVGDVDPAVRTRTDLTITPEKGGVGPLTVSALFDNTIRAATATIAKAKG